jgi:predicted enzyme related to lactoylglutathione lyase
MPTDPLHQMRRLSSPARPNPRFAISLWRRIEEELGMTPTVTTDLSAPSQAIRQLGIVHIRVADADRAIAFFGALLDWDGERAQDERRLAYYVTNTSLLTVLTDDRTAPPVRMFFPVEDVGATVADIDALGGGTDESEVADDGGGWAFVHDDQGVPLGVWRHNDRYARHHEGEQRRPLGEVGYVTLHVPDAGQAMAFYGSLLGWQFEDERGADYHHVENSSPSIGVYGGHDEPHVVWYVRTDDLRSLLPRVAELGGEAGEISESTSGLSATGTDDQGMVVRLWQPAPGY